MRTTTFKRLSVYFILLLFPSTIRIHAQSYCNVTTATSYSSTMPGITNVTLNTINRNSNSLEGTHPFNSFVQTGLSTTLEQGKTYSFSITHTLDPNFYIPNVPNNIRVWIDYNHNGILDDAGETVISMDNKAAGTTTGSFTVPITATLGSAKMRITAKMGAAGGHTLPTPCDNPADPLKYHGEIEDYSVNIIQGTTGINEVGNIADIKVFPNPFTESSVIKYTLAKRSTVSLDIYNLLGSKVISILSDEVQNGGEYTYQFNPAIIANGIYIMKLTVDEKVYVQKLIQSQ